MSDRIIMQQMVQITLIVQSISLILGDTLSLSPSSKLNYHFDQGQQKVFMTGQAKFNSEQCLIKYMGSRQYCCSIYPSLFYLCSVIL